MKYDYKYQDTSFNFEERAKNLVSEMTLSEKISQMRYDAPAIKRLGVPEYNWWNECLHGVARAGEATVFPQGIGMGATWNPSLIKKMGIAVSDEARAKYHKFISEDKRGIYQGLTFWTPNINIFRDPRWGRGQETYGEDPYLTSRIGVNYINGLQGDDSKYLKVVATAKHFAVHSGPEKSRHQDNYHTTQKDLYETYLPAFEAVVKEANVQSVMCAYNRYLDEPCCASNLLLNEILREKWNFKGYVVSDCWAVTDFWEEDKHNIVDTPAEAGALAVNFGTDLNCGSTFDPNLNDAVLQKLVDESKIDLALTRLFTARFKLGMFDNQEDVKWADISYDVVASKEHLALSEKVARESMVLLKNEDQTLPLDKSLKSIAVIGPNANLKQSLLGNYHGTPHNYITPLKGIKDKLPNAKVQYALGSDIAEGWPTLTVIPSKVLRNGNLSGLKGEYYSNNSFNGEPEMMRNDSVVDFTWMPKKPLSNSSSDFFSVRWSGDLVPEETGSYRIGFKASSYCKFFLNDSLQFEFSADHEPKTNYFDLELEKNKAYKIRVEYSNLLSDPQAHFVWAKTDKNLLSEALKIAKESEVVVLCLGLSPEIEGEEMPVVLEGFDKGDRSEIKLPKTQINLMKEVVALGKPTVLVLMNGSAIAVNWANENVPAILEAWYPGEFGGKAIADILFGDYNPGGKLPITFYKSVDDLPDFKSYDMQGRTYKYFVGEPLFPFGHGLSYTTFQYSDLIIQNQISDGEAIEVSVAIKNTGNYKGDEVVQLYVSYPDNANTAKNTLVSFERLNLEVNESKTVTFNISSEQYNLINTEGNKESPNGNIMISVGGNQPNYKNSSDTKSIITLNKTIKIE